MGSKVTIDLDVDVVRDAIHAKVAPAVNKVLARIDLEKLIEDSLTRVADANKKSSRDDWYLYRHAMLYGSDSGEPIIHSLLADEIKKAAHAFVVKSVASERPKIESAFKHMLADSKDFIARTMFAALESGLKSEWNFSLETKLVPKRKDRDE